MWRYLSVNWGGEGDKVGDPQQAVSLPTSQLRNKQREGCRAILQVKGQWPQSQAVLLDDTTVQTPTCEELRQTT